MTASRIDNHVELAKSRLITAFKSSETLNGMISALVAEIQTVEDAFIDRQSQLRLEDAEGEQLDGIGAILDVPRNALDDITYRQRIKIQILINTVSGTRPEIIEVINGLVQFTSSYLSLTQDQRDALSTQVTIRDYYPKSAIVAFEGLGFSNADLRTLGEALDDVAPLGTRVELTAPIEGYSSATFKFSDDEATPATGTGRGFGEGHFVSIAKADVYSIIDLLKDAVPEDWTAQTAAGGYSSPLRSATYGDDLYLIGGDGGEIQTSDDKGVTWTARSLAGTYSFGVTAVAYGGGTYIAAGSGMLQTSPDGITWTERTLDGGYSGFIQAAAYNGSRWVVVGNSGEIQTSDDNGESWTSRTSGTANALQDIVWLGGVFMAVGVSATLLTSPDGITWTSRTPAGGYSGNFYGVAVGPVEALGTVYNIFCAVGSGGEIQTSADDGVTWQQRTAGGGFTGYLYDVEYGGNGKYAAVGASGEIQTSENSVNWNDQTADGGFSSTFLAIANGPINHWVAVGASGEIQTAGE